MAMTGEQQIRTMAVILPIYNEAGIAGEVVSAVHGFSALHPQYHFFFIDDGSDDGTDTIVRTEIDRLGNKALSCFHHQRNQGKGAAIRTGFAMAEAEALCFMDADLAYSLEHLTLMEEGLRTHDVVIGSRKLNPAITRPSLRRHILGESYNRLSRLLLNLPFQDTQAGMKGFRLQAARRLFEKSSFDGFGFDVELLFLARRWGMSIGEIPARVDDRHSYKKGKLKLVKDSAVMFLNLLQIRWKDLTGSYG